MWVSVQGVHRRAEPAGPRGRLPEGLNSGPKGGRLAQRAASSAPEAREPHSCLCRPHAPHGAERTCPTLAAPGLKAGGQPHGPSAGVTQPRSPLPSFQPLPSLACVLPISLMRPLRLQEVREAHMLGPGSLGRSLCSHWVLEGGFRNRRTPPLDHAGKRRDAVRSACESVHVCTAVGRERGLLSPGSVPPSFCLSSPTPTCT